MTLPSPRLHVPHPLLLLQSKRKWKAMQAELDLYDRQVAVKMRMGMPTCAHLQAISCY